MDGRGCWTAIGARLVGAAAGGSCSLLGLSLVTVLLSCECSISGASLWVGGEWVCGGRREGRRCARREEGCLFLESSSSTILGRVGGGGKGGGEAGSPGAGVLDAVTLHSPRLGSPSLWGCGVPRPLIFADPAIVN